MYRVARGPLCGALTTLPPPLCSYCRNTLSLHIRSSVLKNEIRQQGTHSVTSPRTLRKKIKIRDSKKYAELLEVKGKKWSHVSAKISKFDSRQLSELALRPEVSLGQLHKLTPEKKKRETSWTDLELIRNIESTILERYSTEHSESLQDDINAILTVSEHLNKTSIDKYDWKIIKDSYDKFRRETANDASSVDNNFIDGTTGSFNMAEQNETSQNEVDVVDHYDELSYNSNDMAQYLNDKEIQAIDPDVIEEIRAGALVEEDTVPNIKSSKSCKKKKKLIINAETKQLLEEMNRNRKEFSYTKLLLAHLEVCIMNNNVDKAYKVLMHYRIMGQRIENHPKLKNINLYNLILSGYASKGQYNNVCKILQILKEDEIELNLQSYVYILESIERSKLTSKNMVMEKYYTDLLNKGFSFNDIMDKGKFIFDRFDVVLRAIRRVDPSFYPTYSRLNMDYDCELVNHLNPSRLAESLRGYSASERMSSPAEGVITADALKQNVKNQIENEIKGIIEIKNIDVTDDPPQHVLNMRERFNEVNNDWREVIQKAFIRNLHTLKERSNASNRAINIHPYLASLDVKEYVELLLMEIRKIAAGSETYSPNIKLLQRELGSRVYSRYLIKYMKDNGTFDKVVDLYYKYCDWYLNRPVGDMSGSRRKWQQLVNDSRNGVSLDVEYNMWPNSVCVHIGKFLYNILLNDVKIDVNVLKIKTKLKKSKCLPILYNVYRGKGKMMSLEVKPHPLLPRLIKESMPPTLYMDTNLIPSFCPPLPWSDINHGGYLLTKTSVMRTPIVETQQFERLKDASAESLYPALDSLNQLGTIPWIINKPIIDLLISVFCSGGSRKLNVARPVTSVPQPPPANASMSRSERAFAIKERAMLARTRQETYSLWCDSLYKFSLANHFRDEVFWFPHNMDFRGRVYPCPPHLSHLGGDASRAMLLFAKGRPLGRQGLTWLKLHCVNLTGTMKRSTIQERSEYAEKILDDILDSADRPLDGRQWWAKSEEPWQTLACCMEIAKAMRSPNPEEYICHFPIHQDGSCNGLQHYAALGRDSAGAFSVNLSNADRPQDVYSAVVTLVEAARLKDAENGIPIAKILDGFVKRKVIKQTVMTTVYGVTKYGARLQIAKKLKDMDSFPKEHVWVASSYLANKTFDSIKEMFTSTKEIQDWFTECAKLISGICGAKIEWVTPLGLPVVQPYFKSSKSGAYKDQLNEFMHTDMFEKPCLIKQKNAFPPNFIHSLDSSHMMLTSLHCEMSNITFVSVHDCFWTHPESVEIMNKICREQFLALHSQPILETLSEFLVKKFSFSEEGLIETGSAKDASKKRLNSILRQLPEKGDFDLKKVLESIYFFS